MKILMLHRQNTAVGYYRTRVPARMLEKLGHEVTWFEVPYERALKPKSMARHERVKMVQDPLYWAEEWLKENIGKFDLVWVDRAASHREWSLFAGFRHYSEGCRMIVDMDDDFTDVPAWNQAAKNYHPGQEMYDAGLCHLRNSEMVTVSTERLAEKFADKSHAIRVKLNRVDPVDWENLPVNPERKGDPCVRVLYGGAAGHLEDLKEIRGAVEGMLAKPPVPWRLICFGPVPAFIRELQKKYPGKVVSLPWVPFEDYAKVVAWGGFDLALGPLKECGFNECKSNIKWLEAGMQGIPFVCSDVGPYSEIPDGTAVRVENTAAQWATVLRELLLDKGVRDEIAVAAEDAVRAEWTVDKGGETLQSIVEEASTRPRILSLEDSRLPGDQAADESVEWTEPTEGPTDPKNPTPEGSVDVTATGPDPTP